VLKLTRSSKSIIPMQKIKELVHHAKPSKSSTTEESTTQTTPALDAQEMSPILAGKVALITGGSKGIGKATALALHKLGAKVVVNYGRDSAAANTFVKELGGEANALAVRADAGSMSGVEKLVTEATARYGKRHPHSQRRPARHEDRLSNY
jgi:FlaA1/EpsC-like NDP-sugar epimerase